MKNSVELKMAKFLDSLGWGHGGLKEVAKQLSDTARALKLPFEDKNCDLPLLSYRKWHKSLIKEYKFRDDETTLLDLIAAHRSAAR